MAGRSIKQGLVFFPFDCDLFKDRKIRLLERQHPRLGTLAYLHILCEIYRDKGYFVPADDVLYDEVESALRLEVGEACELVASAVKCGLFDEQMYEMHSILTSRGIQRRYNEAVRNSRRRGYITSSSEFSLICGPDEESANGSVSAEQREYSSQSEQDGAVSSESFGNNADNSGISSESKPISSEEMAITSEEMAISYKKPAHKGKESKGEYNTHTQPVDKKERIVTLLKAFIHACASADGREQAQAILHELQALQFYGSGEWKSMAPECRFVLWLWLYYPELQLAFEDPMINWQARQLVNRYQSSDIQRIVERIANVKGIASEKRSFYLTVLDWLRRDYQLQNPK